MRSFGFSGHGKVRKSNAGQFLIGTLAKAL